MKRIFRFFDFSIFRFSAVVAMVSAVAGGAFADEVTNIVVHPLTQAHWVQGEPYNQYTPHSSWLSGCEAISSSQELLVWRWPWRLEAIHTASHKVNGESDSVIRFDGSVPIDWDSLLTSYGSGATLKQKHEAARLSLMCQSLLQMQYVSGGAEAMKQIPGTMEWFEYVGTVKPNANGGDDDAVAAIRADLEFGSPVQVGVPHHAVVGLGYATGTNSVGEAADFIWLNYGWGGGSDGWYNLRSTESYGSGIPSPLDNVHVGFRPIKSVQIEPIAPISGNNVTLNWHLPNCYTNKIDGFTVAKKKLSAGTTTWEDNFNDGGKGRSSNNNVMRVEDGFLSAWNGTVSAIYTFDDKLAITADSVLSYNLSSAFMAGIEARIEAKVGDSAWQTIHKFELSSYNQTWGQNFNVEIPLSDYAGKIMQIRVAAEYTNGGNYVDSKAKLSLDYISISNVKTFETVGEPETINDVAVQTKTFTGLEQDEVYAFTVAPIMSDGSAAITQTATTTIGTPAASPVIGTVTMSPRGTDLIQEGFYTDIAMGWNIIDVACQNVATLEAFPSHQSVLSQETVEVVDNGNGSFSINIDATEVASKWAGQRMILTLKATNSTGETTYKDLELRLVASGVPENVPGGVTRTFAAGTEGDVVAQDGATIVLVLTEEQESLGYTASTITLNGNATLRFENEDGEEVAYSTSGGSYISEAAANVWTASVYGMYSDVSCWSKKRVPIEEDKYVVFNHSGNTKVYIDSNISLNKVVVIGSGTFKFEDMWSDGYKVSIESLANETPFTVNSEVASIGELKPSANVTIDSGVTLSSVINYSAVNYLTKADLQNSSKWRGTVVVTGADNHITVDNLGNSQSFIKMNGNTGSLMWGDVANVPIELVDPEGGVAFNWNNGYGSRTNFVDKIFGSGTLKVSGTGTYKTEKVVLRNIGEFTGSMDLSSKTLVIGNAVPETTTDNGRLYICSDYDAIISSGKTWKIGGGMYLGGNQTITVSGTLNGAITAEGTGTTLALKPTSAVTAASLVFTNNTISIEKSASAAAVVTVSGEVNLAGSTIAVTLSDEATDSIALMSADSFTGVDSATLTGLEGYELQVEDGILYAKSLNAGYSGPQPTTTWVSWAFEDYASDHGGYSITLNNNTINSDGNIVIGSGAIKGVTIELPSGTYTNASLLVKCKTPQGGAPMANAAIAGVLDSDNNPMAPICTTAGDNSFIGGYLNKNNGDVVTSGYYSYGFSTPPPTLPENKEAYMLFAFEATTGKGTALYLGEDIASLAGGNAGYLNWPNRKINVMAIGGSTQSNSNFGAWTDLEIEAVALFVDKWLTPGDIAGYEFPEPEEPVRTDVHYKSGFWGEGGENPFVVVLDNDKPTTVLEGETVIIDDKSSGVDTIYFGATLPENANKIRVARNVIFSSGENNPSMLDGATITVDDGVTLTFKRQWNNIVLGDVTIDGPGAVKFDHNDGTITIGGALSGTAAVTVETGKQISVAADGAIANTIAGDGTVAYASMPSVPMPLAASWTGTVELPQFTANGQMLTDYCNNNSKLKLNGINGGCLHWTSFTLNAELILAGDFVLTDMSERNFAFTKISGSGNISLSPKTYDLTSFTIGELAEGFAGAVTNNMNATKIVITDLMLPANTPVTPGSKVLAIGGSQDEGVKVTNVKVGGVLQNVQLERRNKGEDGDGLYVKAQIETEGEGENEVVTVVTEPEQESVEVPVANDFTGTIVVAPTVKFIDAGTAPVSAEQVKVKYGGNDITGAFTVSADLSLALDENGKVNDVDVKPAIDEGSSIDEGQLTVKAIPGLWYGVKYGDALEGGDIGGTSGNTTPKQATDFGDKELFAPKGGACKFYRVRVGARRSDIE